MFKFIGCVIYRTFDPWKLLNTFGSEVITFLPKECTMSAINLWQKTPGKSARPKINGRPMGSRNPANVTALNARRQHVGEFFDEFSAVVIGRIRPRKLVTRKEISCLLTLCSIWSKQRIESNRGCIDFTTSCDPCWQLNKYINHLSRFTH